MRMEKVSEHDFSKDVGMKLSGDDLKDINWTWLHYYIIGMSNATYT